MQSGMSISIVTLFPEMFKAFTDFGISSRAIKAGLMEIEYWNPRDYTVDTHRTVDDRPYGGGPGMVMMVEPLVKTIRAAKRFHQEKHRKLGNALEGHQKKVKTLYLSPQGKPLTQADVKQLAAETELLLLCGRYEGVDERVIELEVDEQISIGDYVLSGGELPAMVLLDAIVRLLPGALGHKDSAIEDSFYQGLLDHPHYTRPEEFEGLAIPEVLASGHHQEIAKWRHKKSLETTWLKRPDLLNKLDLTDEQIQLLEKIKYLSNGNKG